MNPKCKSLILESSPAYAKSIQKILVSLGYEVIEITGSIRKAIKLTSIHQFELLTLELILADGNGLSVIEYIVSHIHEFKKLPLVIVISENISEPNRDEITRRLASVEIIPLFFDKKSNGIWDNFSENLSKANGDFNNNLNPRFYPSDLTSTAGTGTKEKISKSDLDNIIREKVKNEHLNEEAMSFEYLQFSIKEWVINPPKKGTLNEICKRGHKFFKTQPESIYDSLKNMGLESPPRKFILRTVREIVTEYDISDLK